MISELIVSMVLFVGVSSQSVRVDAGFEMARFDFSSCLLEGSIYSGKLTYSPLPGRLDFFGVIGTGKSKANGWGINGNIDRFWRAGAEMIVWENTPWSVSLGGQVEQWMAQDSILLAGHDFGSEMDLWIGKIRSCVSYRQGGLTIYGGPQWQMFDGEISYGWLPLKNNPHKVDFCPHQAWGCYGGASACLAVRLSFNVEGELSQVETRFSVGVGLGF